MRRPRKGGVQNEATVLVLRLQLQLLLLHLLLLVLVLLPLALLRVLFEVEVFEKLLLRRMLQTVQRQAIFRFTVNNRKRVSAYTVLWGSQFTIISVLFWVFVFVVVVVVSVIATMRRGQATCAGRCLPHLLCRKQNVNNCCASN